MNKEIKAYIKTEAIISAAFSFFINGMAAALIYHKADNVPADSISIGADLTATCLLVFILTLLFSRASVKRTKTAGILKTGSGVIRFLGRLFDRPVLFVALSGVTATAVLFALTVPLFALLGVRAFPFGYYVTLKCVFTALFGGSATILELYMGMARR